MAVKPPVLYHQPQKRALYSAVKRWPYTIYSTVNSPNRVSCHPIPKRSMMSHFVILMWLGYSNHFAQVARPGTCAM